MVLKKNKHKKNSNGTDMAVVLRLFFVIALIAPALAQAETGTVELNRQPRSHRRRLCRKYGICGNQGFVGQGSQQGYQQGYQGYPPAINIGISQSQSSASAGGGGYSNGYYPNNNQYNGYPNPGYGGYQGGYGGNQGHGGFGRPDYFGNGQGGYNNQFNGNYYGPGAGNVGGYGIQGPFQGGYHDEPENHDDPAHLGENDDHNPHAQDDQENYNDYNHGPQEPQGQGYYGHGQDYALSGSFAFAGRKNN